MGVNPIPDKLKSFRVYLGEDSTDLLGVVDLTLPKIEPMTETLAGAGIAGEIDMPVAGHLGSMTVTLKWRMVNKNVVALAAAKAHRLDMRGAAQVYDAGEGELKTEALKIVVQGIPKSIDLGKFETGKVMDTETEFEVLSIRLSVAGEEKLNIDKLNNIYEVDGTDYLAEDRSALGLSE